MSYQLYKQIQTTTKAKNYNEALKLCDKIPDISESFVSKAGVYYQMGKDELVFEHLNKALSINEKCANAYINRALYHRHNKNYIEAQEDYDKAMTLSPSQFNIVLFNEEDIFKNGKFDGFVSPKNNLFPTVYPKEGHLHFDIWLKAHKQGNSDTGIAVGIYDMPYFFISRFLEKVAYNQRLMKFQYWFAKQIFKFKTNVLGVKVRPLR